MEKEVKIAYIYLNDLCEKRANINQTLHMVEALGKKTKVTFLSCWISRKDFKTVSQFFSVKTTYKLIRLPIKLFTNNLFFEKISRLLYCLCVLLFLRFSTVDVIYTRDYSFVYFLSVIPKILRPKQKIFYEIHTIYHLTSKKVNFESEKRSLFIPDYIIATTENTKDSLSSLFHLERNKIFVLPNGVDTDHFSKFKKNKNVIINRYKSIKQNDIVVIYSGTFLWWKGVETFVKSAKYLDNINIKYLLLGGTGSEKENIENLIKQESLEQRVIVDGFLPQDEMIPILISSDIAVIPNNITPEGEKYTSPLKIFEYLACKLPIVASNLSSIRLILKDNVNCLFFEPENERDLAKKIHTLVDDPDLYHTLSIYNEKDSQKYSWNSRANNILSVIKYEKLDKTLL